MKTAKHNLSDGTVKAYREWLGKRYGAMSSIAKGTENLYENENMTLEKSWEEIKEYLDDQIFFQGEIGTHCLDAFRCGMGAAYKNILTRMEVLENVMQKQQEND